MDEAQPFLPKTSLPPRRKPAIGGNIDSGHNIETDLIQEESSVEEIEIDPELLAEFEQAGKETGSEVIIDIPAPSKESTVTAPILEDYIDPHAVPIRYLLEQARAQVKPDQVLPKDSSDSDT